MARRELRRKGHRSTTDVGSHFGQPLSRRSKPPDLQQGGDAKPGRKSAGTSSSSSSDRNNSATTCIYPTVHYQSHDLYVYTIICKEAITIRGREGWGGAQSGALSGFGGPCGEEISGSKNRRGSGGSAFFSASRVPGGMSLRQNTGRRRLGIFGASWAGNEALLLQYPPRRQAARTSRFAGRGGKKGGRAEMGQTWPAVRSEQRKH